MNNIILAVDSYKQIHDQQYPEGIETVYSYLEARKGAEYPVIVFFGLQYIIKNWFEGTVITKEMIDEAEIIFKEHFKFNGNIWSRKKFDYIVEKHGGKLPIRIRAVPEGLSVPIDNILVSVENTDPNCFWLTNFIETILQQVWYPITVCTRSKNTVDYIKKAFKKSVEDDLFWLSSFMIHDFGARACTCVEQAGLGGMAHLVNSKGTDTDMAILFAMKYYNADIDGLAYSVPASEHSIASALGKEGEFDIARRLINLYPKGILSHVSDSFDIERAVNAYCSELKDDIIAREGKFVIRPDSPRYKGEKPIDQILWIVDKLALAFGFTINSKGFKVLNEKVGIIYGDGLCEQQIYEAINGLLASGWSASTCVFGQGGGLLQRDINRDTCRFAMKCSAQKRNGVWYDIAKEPVDTTKTSKRGRLKLVRDKTNQLITVSISDERPDVLQTVFENGKLLVTTNLSEIRERAE